MKFQFTGKVRRVVEDTISVVVDSDTETDAYEKAEKVLKMFPKEHTEEGVPFCYIENRDYLETEVIDLDMREDKGVA